MNTRHSDKNRDIIQEIPKVTSKAIVPVLAERNALRYILQTVPVFSKINAEIVSSSPHPSIMVPETKLHTISTTSDHFTR